MDLGRRVLAERGAGHQPAHAVGHQVNSLDLRLRLQGIE